MTIAEQKIEHLNALLERRFGLRVTMESAEHLQTVAEHYAGKCDDLRAILGVGAIMHPDYTKASLIHEAARILLQEICPRRAKKRKNHRSDIAG